MSLAPLIALLLLAAALDLRSRRIPNLLPLIIILGTMASMLLAPAVVPTPGWLASLLGMAVAAGILLPGYVAGALGAGDVKLMAAAAFFTGWPLAVPLLLFSAVALGAWCVAALLLGYRGRQPAAPAMAAGAALVALLTG